MYYNINKNLRLRATCACIGYTHEYFRKQSTEIKALSGINSSIYAVASSHSREYILGEYISAVG